MADTNLIEVRFGANVDGIRSGAREASGHVDGLLASLKEFKSETVQTGREARFFASQIAAIVPEAGKAKAVIQDLIAAAVSGGGIGAALEVTRLLVGVFHELSEEARKTKAEVAKAADDWLAHIKAVHDETEKLRVSLRGVSTIQLEAYAALQPLREQQLRQQAALSKAEGDLAEAESKARKATGSALTSTLTIRTSLTAHAHKEIADAREALRITKEKIAELEKEFALRSRIASAAPLQKEIAEAESRAAQATEDSAINLARIQTEQEDAEAKRLGQVRLTAEEKIKLAQEIADAQVRANEQTELSAINLGLIETQQRSLTRAQRKEAMAEFHAMAATAKEVGDAIGAALVGMASDSMSATKVIVEMLKMVIRSVIEMAIKMVIARAATAAAGAAESQSAIPVAGPWLAIGALAMVEGAVLALLSMIPGAATGADIPRGVNPIMQLHGGESVITRRTTDRLQDFLDGQGSGDGGGGMTLNFHFNGPTDVDGMKRWVRSYEFRNALRYARSLGEL